MEYKWLCVLITGGYVILSRSYLVENRWICKEVAGDVPCNLQFDWYDPLPEFPAGISWSSEASINPTYLPAI